MWTDEGYNTYKLDLAGFKGSVMWESNETGFRARFESWVVKRRFQSLSEAKAAVEKLAMFRAEELLAAVVSLKK